MSEHKTATDIATREHWDATYSRAPAIPDFANLRSERVLRAFIGQHVRPRPGQRMVELGAGNTGYLPALAHEFGIQVAGLDYSHLGVSLARRNLAAAGVDGEIREGICLIHPRTGWAPLTLSSPLVWLSTLTTRPR